MKQQEIKTPPCEIRSFKSAEELARAVARDWLELLQMLEMGGKEPTVALSGGRIAQTLFVAANKLFTNHRNVVHEVHFFWADERCVPPDHPESNYGVAASHLLKPLGVSEAKIHRVPGEIVPVLAATTAARGLMKWTETYPGEVPRLDLVLLGMGEDGHVASLFPGESKETMESPEVCRAVTAVKPPPQRVTVSYGVLSKAENLWVLASGSGKETALKDSLTSAEKTPLGRVLSARSGTRIYTDLSPAGGFGV